ncbi:MAG: triose-phosphate isomerase [Candidatus Eremiobacteraeota bacterium]|nr:triose-phosphate isomerase [Candidatus Eremiobacteraeota bacterium]
MHKTVAEARALVREIRAAALPRDVDVVVAPPFTALAAVHEELYGSHIGLCAQNMHESSHGAYTGEIAPTMLYELGVRFAILGHSERRAYYGETDAAVNRKVKAALAHGITPIVAVGETKEEYLAGRARERVRAQARAAFADVVAPDVARCVVAYEPIWAIGTGLNDEPANAGHVIGEIRGSVEGLEHARLLYGGSMKGENAAALMAQPNIDGGLIGGASLTAHGFLAVLEAASASTSAR